MSVEEIGNKEWTIYNFPKDVVKSKGSWFLMPYNETYHFCFKVVVSFHLFVKYDLCCSKSQISTESESISYLFQGAERLWKSTHSYSLKD